MASKNNNYLLRGALIKLTTMLIFLIISILISAGVYIAGYELIAYSMLLIPAILFLLIIKLFSYNSRKVAYMFDSIENNDFSFQFSEGLRSDSDRLFNRALNRIKDLILATTLRIEENEKYYELIMSQTGSGVIVIDHKGSVYQHNAAALDIFGMSVLTHINQLAVLDEAMPVILRELKPSARATIKFYNERGEICLSLLSTEIKTRGRNLKIVSITNIGSELEGREVESWQRLSRVLTHEIMNSIAPISSLSQTLLSTPSNSDNVRKGLEVINTTSKGLISFVDNYRSLTRIPTPTLKLFNLKPLLERIVALMPEGSVVVERCEEDVILLSDESMVQQVILNIAKNGVQAGGNVAFRVSIDTAQHVIIDVENDGEPISRETAENIFVPFFTTKHGGSGIGLSLSRQIMRLLGGHLSLINPGSDEHKTLFRITME